MKELFQISKFKANVKTKNAVSTHLFYYKINATRATSTIPNSPMMLFSLKQEGHRDYTVSVYCRVATQHAQSYNHIYI